MAHARVNEEGRRTEAEVERLITESLHIGAGAGGIVMDTQTNRPKVPQPKPPERGPWNIKQRKRMRDLMAKLDLLEPIGGQ